MNLDKMSAALAGRKVARRKKSATFGTFSIKNVAKH